MRHQEWKRTVATVAEEYGATVENRGHKLVIHLPNGRRVWCASTPSHPAPDRLRKDIQRELVKPARSTT